MIKKVLVGLSLGLWVLFLVGCQNNSKDEGYVKQDSNEVEIGFKDRFSFRFLKLEGNWNFDGVYVDKDDIHVFDTLEQDFYRFAELGYNDDNPGTGFDTKIDSVEVIETDGMKEVIVANEQVTLTLSIDEGTTFIKRVFVINNTIDNQLADYQLSFTLRTNPDVIVREYGSIATKSPADLQSDIPYAFPALYTKLYSEDAVYNVVNVIDYEQSDRIFGKIRKRIVGDLFELGATSSTGDITDETLIFVDYWDINSEDKSYFDLIGNAADQYLAINPMHMEDLANRGNLVAGSFSNIVDHLYENIMDERSGYGEFLGAMKAYAFMEDLGGGYGQSFATLDTTKGMLRYALAQNDSEKIAEVTSILTRIIAHHEGEKNWIEPYTGQNAKDDEYFLHYNYVGGSFLDNSSGEETGSTVGISGWKYYDQLANVADIAYITDDTDIKEGFLKLMPFLNSLKLEDYSQPVAWFYQTRQPATGYDEGGSAGNASSWAYIHLMASIIGDDQYYKDEALKALDTANNLDYYSMTAMRVAVKPVAIGWNVRANVLAYELTSDEKYLEHAKVVAKSLLSFYYLNSNPQTYFATQGFGYADLRERWEAYLEMAQSLWLITPIMEYMADDQTLLDVLYAASKTYVYAFPINGDPYGNYKRLPGYDSLDAYYVPFEFTTGVIGDNPGAEGGAQAAYRQTKELYGSGEAFLNYLMFEGFGYSSDQALLVLSLTGSHNDIDRTNQSFILYNPSLDDKNSPVMFRNLEEGNYNVFLNGVSIGLYSIEQLNQGITIGIDSRESIVINVEKE